jgi:hypothetical protein
MIPRLALITSCVIALGGLVAAPAGAAAAPPTLGPTSSVTPESATVSATIATGGVDVTYSFEYDTASDLAAGGNNAFYTDPVNIPAGVTTPVTVTAPLGCYPAAMCAIDQSPLTPGSKYEVILFINFGTGGQYYYTASVQSAPGYFNTPKLGSVTYSGSSKVRVVKGKASLGLKCASGVKCAGKFMVTTKHKGKTLTCASGKFSIKAGKTASESVKLSGSCKSMLTKAGKLGVKLTTTTSTDQKNVNEALKLVVGSSTGKKK